MKHKSFEFKYEDGRRWAITSRKDYEGIAAMLPSELQTTASSEFMLKDIDSILSGEEEKIEGIGNWALIRMNSTTVQISDGMWDSDDPTDYGPVEEMPLEEFRDLVDHWKSFLENVPSQNSDLS